MIIKEKIQLKGIASLYCSANVGKKGDVAIFFGLSGTEKTILSTDLALKFINNFSKFAINEETAKLADSGTKI